MTQTIEQRGYEFEPVNRAASAPKLEVILGGAESLASQSPEVQRQAEVGADIVRLVAGTEFDATGELDAAAKEIAALDSMTDQHLYDEETFDFPMESLNDTKIAA